MNLFGKCFIWLGLLTGVQIPVAASLLQIDQNQSKIQVAVRSTAGAFTAKLEKYEAAIECDSAKPLPTKADVSFDFKDLKTGVKGRDAHMLEWLHYPHPPDASFHLKSWKQDGADTWALGELTIHGNTREIRMLVSVTRRGETYDIEGTLGLDYRDFGLPKIRSAVVFSVDPHLKIIFHLIGKLSP